MKVSCFMNKFKTNHTCQPVLNYYFFFSILFLFCVFTKNVNAQNLFANPGFEDINTCSEYHATCAPEAWFYINPATNPLVSGKAAVSPMLGNNILLVPVGNVFSGKATPAALYTMLACSLKAGEQYKLSFFLNSSGRKFHQLDFVFSKKEPSGYHFNVDSASQIVSILPQHIIADMKQKWKAVEIIFTAGNDAEFCLIGNYSGQPFSFSLADQMSKSGNVYYFLDEIKLQPIIPGTACSDYDAVIQKMYAQDSRHTDHIILKEDPPVNPKSFFVTDTISIPAAYFKTGKADLDKKMLPAFDSIVALIEKRKLYKIEVTGHTDNQGDSAINQKLSLQRANTVKDRMILIAPGLNDIIFTEGKGAVVPVADNNSAAGRAMNRRVEIILTCAAENNQH
jgi:outer membrane protein OmpA-like peptidoglycan-associated protein